jgi:hypothetical protein
MRQLPCDYCYYLRDYRVPNFPALPKLSDLALQIEPIMPRAADTPKLDGSLIGSSEKKAENEEAREVLGVALSCFNFFILGFESRWVGQSLF